MICWFAGKGGFDCGGRGQLHHVIPQSKIRQRFPHGALFDGTPAPKLLDPGVPTIPVPVLLTDERNLIFVCGDHHERWHNARFDVYLDDLPDSVVDFASDYGFEPYLERTFARKRRAA